MKRSGITYKLLYTARAQKDISKLDPSVRKIVKNALERISNDPSLGKPLTHSLKGYYSFRISDYRIIYEISSKDITLLVVAVGHRRNIYEKLKHLIPLKKP